VLRRGITGKRVGPFGFAQQCELGRAVASSPFWFGVGSALFAVVGQLRTFDFAALPRGETRFDHFFDELRPPPCSALLHDPPHPDPASVRHYGLSSD
jgi:hypothetical protein